MPSYRIDSDTFLLKAADLGAEKLGPLPVGTVFSGQQQGNFIKTKIASVSPEEGFVQFFGKSSRMPEAQPLTVADFGNFCDLVTRAARETGADRDYLMAVAYDSTKNLTDFGGAGAAKAGPFQFTEQAWQAAIAGPAADGGFTLADRLDWPRQPKMAAIVAADATGKFKEALDRPPTFKELYFFQLLGADALAAIKTPARLCKDVISSTPAAGTYAAELKASDLTVDAALTQLQKRLVTAYAEALKVIDLQPPENRFVRAAAGDPAWLAIAREQMASGVSETPDRKNTEQIDAYFKAVGASFEATTPWCGAFVGYCVKQCGVAAIASTVKPDAVGTKFWESWGQPAPTPPPVGSIVVLAPGGSGGHVGFLAEGSTSAMTRLLGGNQGGGGKGPDRVGIVQFPVASNPIVAVRWMGTAPLLAAPKILSGDATFVGLAPRIMKGLLRDFQNLNDMHVAAILGNIGHECAGFTQMQEGSPISGGRGGWGWCQWTGSRRDDFEREARAKGLAFDSFEANYSFLVHELKDTFLKAAIDSVLREQDIFEAVKAFERSFEKAHADHKHYDRRLRYAQIALTEFRKGAP